jgi:hypothetical protein
MRVLSAVDFSPENQAPSGIPQKQVIFRAAPRRASSRGFGLKPNQPRAGAAPAFGAPNRSKAKEWTTSLSIGQGRASEGEVKRPGGGANAMAWPNRAVGAKRARAAGMFSALGAAEIKTRSEPIDA